MPLTEHDPSTTSSLEEFLARERLLDAVGSSSAASGVSSLVTRNSRQSLVRRSKDLDSLKTSENWRRCMPVLVFLALFVLLAGMFGVMLVALLRVRNEHLDCQRHGLNPFLMTVREDTALLDDLSKRLSSTFDARRIKRNLAIMSRTAHLAGTMENMNLIKGIADEYSRMGFDTRLQNYTVLLSYPVWQRPNTVEIRDDRGEWWLLSRGRGVPLGPDEAQRQQSDPRSQHWWNAYSANGTVEGPLVYCNYGMSDDYEQLKEVNIDVREAIVLIRYGGISRAEKVREAQLRGAIGVILFTDPVHYNYKNKTFPFDTNLPGSDAQRGSVLATHGDPLTPLLPALPWVFRSESVESAASKGHLPSIPVTPIGFDDVQRIFARMDGHVVKWSQWNGALTTPYRITGSRLFRLAVKSRVSKRTITNIIASWRGREEPDSLVLVGNHIDAWGTGAIDPLSGTATQMEMARVFAKTFSSRAPRRTVMFCHWDAEEYGLIGSTEWIEHFQHLLGQRAVAYVNVDHIAGNVSLDVKGVPLLYRTVSDAAKKVRQRSESELSAGRRTLWDSWRHHRPRGQMLGEKSIGEIGLPTGGSDYQRFISFLGVPALDLKMESKPGQSYALYHTMYETMWTVDKLIDPTCASHLAMGQLWIEITHRLANSLVIPFNVADYSRTLMVMVDRAIGTLDRLEISRKLPDFDQRVDYLKRSLRRMHSAAKSLQQEAQEISSGAAAVSVIRLNQLNSRLSMVERCFLDHRQDSVDHRHNPVHRHLVFSPSRHPPNIGALPSLVDPAFDMVNGNYTSASQFYMAFTKIQFAVESATQLLEMP